MRALNRESGFVKGFRCRLRPAVRTACGVLEPFRSTDGFALVPRGTHRANSRASTRAAVPQQAAVPGGGRGGWDGPKD